MFARVRFIPPILSGDWKLDGRNLLNAIQEYLLSLDRKGGIALSADDLTGPAYAPGSFTVATGTGRVFVDTLQLNASETGTFEGTSTGIILG